MSEKIHLKGLNGIRGIAVISVVLSHTHFLDEHLSFTLQLGLAQYAVTIFFALSGFLITYLLFIEKERSGISIKKFYIRRALRIWPLYFIYLLAAIITIYIYNPNTLPGSLPWYLFFAANVPHILHTHLPYLTHYWTLGVEEQFYLFWPWVIKGARNVLKGLVIFTLIFLAVKLCFRFYYYQTGNITPLYIMSVTRFECMSLGGIAALLCLSGNRIFLQIATHPLTEIICWLCLLLMALNKFYISPILDHDLAALVGIGLIVNLGFNKKPLIDLENRFFDLMGKLSYGMYIIHPLVIFYYSLLLSRWPVNDSLKPFIVYTGSLLFTIAVAWLSYEFFEKRFLHIKDRFSTVKNLA